jgi:hypothetical protein
VVGKYGPPVAVNNEETAIHSRKSRQVFGGSFYARTSLPLTPGSTFLGNKVKMPANTFAIRLRHR